MTKSSARLAILLFSFMALFPAAATALDIPVLTWERGRIQEVILGDLNTATDWKLQLVGENTSPIEFTASTKNESGFYVYSAQIPADLPPGAYSLETSGGGLPKTIVAGVNLIVAETYDIRKDNRDLSFVVGLLTFITVTLSSLRSSKYSRLAAIKSGEALVRGAKPLTPIRKLLERVMNLRTELTQGVRPSLFRYLLGQESEFLSRISKTAFYILPLISIAMGFFAATNAEANGGLEKSNLFYFFLITLLGLVDSFSGIFALFTFWLIQFYNGDVSDVNQILIMVAAAIAWVGPSLAARVYQDAIAKDFESKEYATQNRGSLLLSVLGSAVAATAIFFGGYKLLVSLLGEISDSWQMKPLYIVAVFLSALLKAGIMSRILVKIESTPDEEKFEIVRVVSPQIAIAVFTIAFGFSYSWTASGLKALLAALLYSAPYFILFIRFEAIGVGVFSKLKRNILLESVLSVVASFAIYTQIQRLPQLSDQRAEIFLIAAAFPGLIHAIYSSICDSAERKGIIRL